ncbi:abortive infection system antitoxin AbiGi family protein [Aquimarina sediminis]|uniref:abortive infection system antitoxin AbiGi family protein n=1 Tax=Aquimarina sediminis TaxID=2070536 RepID=UPI000CA05D7F|nr:abortive infection system antitoxin AbiGi family protein [Aquimarina sediminis]
MSEEFKQKKINHIFHYTGQFDWLKKILKNGFAPSYCEETINNSTYYIPMVSFCNIPLKDVDNYMHYGKYGIGMSMEWAIKHQLSPVIYIHENSPIKDLYDTTFNLTMEQFIKKSLFDSYNKHKKITNKEYPLTEEQILNLYSISQKTVQFLKNWKTKHKGNEIITYQEREWRFIPNLKKVEELEIIKEDDDEFSDYKNKRIKKPHLPDYLLQIENITDIRYITIKNENQRPEIIKILEKKFGEPNLKNSIISGKLVILTENQLHNDF